MAINHEIEIGTRNTVYMVHGVGKGVCGIRFWRKSRYVLQEKGVEVSGKNFLETNSRLEERKETKSERFGIGFDVSSS